MFDVRQEITAGNTLVREAIQSQNFVTGLSGWQIKANGDAEFNNLIARGEVIVGTVPGPHIRIGQDALHHGIIEFFTGDAAELTPSALQPDAVANLIGILFHSAGTAADNLGSTLSLYTHKFAASNSQAQLSSTGEVDVYASRLVWIQNNGTGDFIKLDQFAGSQFQAPHVDIFDQSLSGNQGISVVNGYVQPLNNNVWIGTATTPLTGTWVDVAGARFGYFKDATGRVTVRGKVSGGGAGATIVTLPVGYRPSSNLDFSMRSGTTLCAVGVSTAGVLTVTANLATATVSGINLDVISFPTN